MSASFDRIAKPYQSLETLCFGGELQSVRQFCIPHTTAQKDALLLGDGDGRFSCSLLDKNPSIHIDSIDSSKRMLQIAAERTAAHKDRITHIHADALECELASKKYDLVCLHFFVDCFTQAQVELLEKRILASLKPEGLIAYSDFSTTNLWQRFLVEILYCAFRASAGIKAKKLPRFERPNGFREIASTQRLGGLLFSKVWKSSD